VNTAWQQITGRLARQGVFAPGSAEQALHEQRLTRFFEREFRRHQEMPQSLSELGISTAQGPLMERTGELMKSHYDERPEFFATFLDRRYCAYSMAWYGNTANEVRASDSNLEQAQRDKFALIASRAGIEGTERILNIGCGFGSLETFLLEEYPDIQVTGITPSRVQIDYLSKRMQNPADLMSGGRFRLVAGGFDPQSLDQIGRAGFDLVISIGVVEHVRNMKLLLECIAQTLVPGGRTFHHYITSRSPIPRFLDPLKSRIGLYFPGGRVWPHGELLRHTGLFEPLNSWFVNGMNYWRTLHEWHVRYWEGLPALYDSVFDEKEIAHWNEYFSLCKAVFAPMEGNFYGNSHYLLQLRQA
jgi:cyclopropane-fatty-acyl-phospholipid synthase